MKTILGWGILVGGAIIAAIVTEYSGGSVLRVSDEHAVNVTAMLMVLAFFGVTVYEDWKDAREAQLPRERG